MSGSRAASVGGFRASRLSGPSKRYPHPPQEGISAKERATDEMKIMAVDMAFGQRGGVTEYGDLNSITIFYGHRKAWYRIGSLTRSTTVIASNLATRIKA